MPVELRTPNLMMLQDAKHTVLAWFCPQCNAKNEILNVECCNCEVEKPWTCGLCHTANFGSRKTCVGCKVAARPVLPRQVPVAAGPAVAQPFLALPTQASSEQDQGPCQLDAVWAVTGANY